MSKLSRRFRELIVIKYLISFRSKIFSKFKFYPQYRHCIRYSKWYLKYLFFPTYKEVKKIISNNYKDFSIFRPDNGFTYFDIALVAYKKEDKDYKNKIFIHIATKNHFTKNNKISYKFVEESFKAKEKFYKKFYNEVYKQDKNLAEDMLQVIDFFRYDSFLIFATKYIDFIPIAKFLKSKEFNTKIKSKLIKQLEFYHRIFDHIPLLWSDATPINLMISSKNLNLVPVDFVPEHFDESLVQEMNDKIVKKIRNYLETGIYNY